MPQPRRPLIAGNWKMNGSRDALRLFMSDLRRHLDGSDVRCDVAVCPPAQLLALAAEQVAGSDIQVGAQDCHAQAGGAHTGDISAEMIADAGAGLVIVGHSERRADHGESDGDVRAKAEAAHHAGLVAIICVGETEAERAAGDTLSIVQRQVTESLPDGCSAHNTVIAYEPVWAIGSGRTPTADNVAEVHGHIRQSVAARFADGTAFRVLYGGSVKPANARELLAVGDVDGALVGGASLDANDFFAIIDSCP